MIQLAKLVDPDRRATSARSSKTRSTKPKRQAYAKIAQAKFDVDGTSTYPDATFTLRLAFGPSRATRSLASKCPPSPTSTGFTSAPRSRRQAAVRSAASAGSSARTSSNLKTPFNFVCTADIIGGNSGSPVVNRDAEVVGLIFDGNIQSLVLDFIYTDEQARAVSVASQGIVEALRKVYEASDWRTRSSRANGKPLG